MMVAFQLPVYVVLLTGIVLRTSALDTFLAAVYEHAVILSEATPALEDALKLMNRNLDILEGAIKTAAEQGARIIVTPEFGIYGWVFTRETIYPYLEDIPDPEVNWVPCDEPKSSFHGILCFALRFSNAFLWETTQCIPMGGSLQGKITGNPAE